MAYLQVLPACISVPYHGIASKLGLPLILCHPSLMMANWRMDEDGYVLGTSSLLIMLKTPFNTSAAYRRRQKHALNVQSKFLLTPIVGTSIEWVKHLPVQKGHLKLFACFNGLICYFILTWIADWINSDLIHGDTRNLTSPFNQSYKRSQLDGLADQWMLN